MYLVNTPWWMKRIWSSYEWGVQTKNKELYLTFDDGPHPDATPFVLEQLKQYNALATFFCIGKNVIEHPDIYKRVIEEGHSVGNHTHRHLNGWKTSDEEYLNDIAEASNYIDSNLFRPPYGRITRFQAQNLHRSMHRDSSRIIMWSVLSADFDRRISNERCLQNVTLNARPGSIIVFHESEKAMPLLRYALPLVLRYYSERDYTFKRL